MEIRESRCLVLYNRPFREQDKLVKLFTETSGKRMFFVKQASQSKLAPVIEPLTMATAILKINPNGLSYIDDYHHVRQFKQIASDIFTLAYATYIVALADAAVSDNQSDPQLFSFLERTLALMDDGLDYEILTNIFEIQILDRFGISLNFQHCIICQRSGLAFDFSHQYSGLLCPEHYDRDRRRSYLDPNVPYLLERFQSIRFDELQSIAISREMKQKLRAFIDDIYETYVGIQLKSKRFIDDLDKWSDVMKPIKPEY